MAHWHILDVKMTPEGEEDEIFTVGPFESAEAAQKFGEESLKIREGFDLVYLNEASHSRIIESKKPGDFE